MITLLLAAAAAVSTPAAAPVLAVDAAPAAATLAAAKFSSSATSIGDLLDNPLTKAVLVKHAALLVSNPQIDMARSMTLKQVQGFAGDALTDDLLAKIDADLAIIK